MVLSWGRGLAWGLEEERTVCYRMEIENDNKKKKKKENDNKWVNQKSEGNFQRLTDTVKKIGLW